MLTDWLRVVVQILYHTPATCAWSWLMWFVIGDWLTLISLNLEFTVSLGNLLSVDYRLWCVCLIQNWRSTNKQLYSYLGHCYQDKYIVWCERVCVSNWISRFISRYVLFATEPLVTHETASVDIHVCKWTTFSRSGKNTRLTPSMVCQIFFIWPLKCLNIGNFLNYLKRKNTSASLQWRKS